MTTHPSDGPRHDRDIAVLNAIHAAMDRVVWTPDTLEDIARLLFIADRPVREPDAR